ncbi:hypothetical protein KI688_005522 [Linnemannia hyalina]|uniref:Uncharacterized protein n=1 Tax=Linnemannia hyalina TaxID=64524 RepID=A0A9P7Y4S9_9FUNG|nr:hypothetical protein KI688_005522 [Linnemannia hyalina]
MDVGEDLGYIMYARDSPTEPEVRYFRKQVAAALCEAAESVLNRCDADKLRELGFAEDMEECNYWKKSGTKAHIVDMATGQQGKLLELYGEVPEDEDRVMVEILTLTLHEEFPDEKVIQEVLTQEDLIQMEVVQEGEATTTE